MTLEVQPDAGLYNQLVVKHTFLDLDGCCGCLDGATGCRRRFCSDSVLWRASRDGLSDEDTDVGSEAGSGDEPEPSRPASAAMEEVVERFCSPPAVASLTFRDLLAENARLARENLALRQRCEAPSCSSSPLPSPPLQPQPAPQPLQPLPGAPCPQQLAALPPGVWTPQLQVVPQEPLAGRTPSSGSAAPRAPDHVGHIRRRAEARRSLDEDDGVTNVPLAQRTTVMLRNLPNNYSRDRLLELLDSEGFRGQYTFVYLPMDFRTNAAMGYAFVNLLHPGLVPQFWQAFDGYSKWTVPSRKVCFVTWSGPHQGLEAHVERYRNSPVMHESVPDEFRPVIFANGVRVAFPAPTRRPQPPKVRQ